MPNSGPQKQRTKPRPRPTAKMQSSTVAALRLMNFWLQRELVAVGAVEGPLREDWTFIDAYPEIPTGRRRARRELRGRAAVLFRAVAYVHEGAGLALGGVFTFRALSDELTALAKQLRPFLEREWRSSERSLARVQGDAIALSLMEETGELSLLHSLRNVAHSAVITLDIAADLAADIVDNLGIPPTLEAFYGQRGAGAKAHLAFTLDWMGVGETDIADIMRPKGDGSRARLRPVKDLLFRARKAVGVARTKNEVAPYADEVSVLISSIDDESPDVVNRSRRDMSRSSIERAPLDSHGTAPERKSRPAAPRATRRAGTVPRRK